jgi:hydrogenase expression/formation protein HypE
MKENTEFLQEGKLTPEVLAPLLKLTSRGAEIEVEAAVGEDAAVVKGSGTIIITADPITFTEENIGIYTVAVNCNDIVAMGGEPRYLTTTLLLPVGITKRRLRSLFKDLAESSRRAGIHWVGGHTEVSSAVRRIVVSGHAVGFLWGRPSTTAGARPNDRIVMTKWAGLEGTTIIAKTYPEEARRLLGGDSFREVTNWLWDPGISIVNEGRILRGLELSSAHDPTEGGIATGIYEITTRSNVGAEIEWDRIHFREETNLLCRELNLDPLGLLSSGVFLFTASEETATEACRRLQEQDLSSRIIGRITDQAGKVLLNRDNHRIPLPSFKRDEFLKIIPQDCDPQIEIQGS